HGSGLVIGGSDDMPGALAMTVKAALRTGAGLITAGSTKTAIDRVAPQCQEAMYTTLVDQNGYLSNANDLSLDRYDALVVGVGIGRHRKTKRFVMDIVRKATCPLIIDADGLYHIQSDLEVIKKGSPKQHYNPPLPRGLDCWGKRFRNYSLPHFIMHICLRRCIKYMLSLKAAIQLLPNHLESRLSTQRATPVLPKVVVVMFSPVSCSL